MANVTFFLLCQTGITESGTKSFSEIVSEKDFFDTLWCVKEGKTGKQGLLLCSHRSEWPYELAEKADFLAGCLTPLEFVGDSRLVFGYTPNSYIKWELNLVERSVSLSIEDNYSHSVVGQEETGQFIIAESTDIFSIACPFTIPPPDVEPSDRVKRSLMAIFRLARSQAAEEGEEFGWQYLHREGILRLRWGANRAAHLMWVLHHSTWDWLPFSLPSGIFRFEFVHPYMHECLGGGLVVRGNTPEGNAEGFYEAVDIAHYRAGYTDEWNGAPPGGYTGMGDEEFSEFLQSFLGELSAQIDAL